MGPGLSSVSFDSFYGGVLVVIQLQGKLEREVYIACSGGVDSMAVVNFLSKNHDVHMMFFHHGTETSRDALTFLNDYVLRNPTLKLHVGVLTRDKDPRESQEEYWRNQRYEWFHSWHVPVITCHHLDDCVETWIWSSLHGEGKIIPYTNKNVVRPFLLNRKQEFLNWARNRNVPWIEDSSNSDTKYMRNFIRHEIMPKALVVNPGLSKVIRKKVVQNYECSGI